MEDPQFTLQLTDSGSGGPEALRAVRALTGLSLWRSKLLLESTPATVFEEGVPLEVALHAVRRLQQTGVGAAAQCTWCQRSVPGAGAPLDPGPCESRYWPTAHSAANSLIACDCRFCTTYGPVAAAVLPYTGGDQGLPVVRGRDR